MGLLEGKKVLITGASRGIGREIALKFASEGADIAFTCTAVGENCKDTVEKLQAFGTQVIAFASDVSDFGRAMDVVSEVKNRLGRIDVLVNNAGIADDALMMRMKENQWDGVINVNLKGAFNYIHAVTPVMVAQRCGSIISISSVVGVHGNVGQSNYAASKAGLIGMSKSVAKELGSRNVRANVVAPGFILTDMTLNLAPEKLKQWESQIPLRRGGRPSEVAGVCCFLASDLATYVNGQVIEVDGGIGM